MSAPYPQPVGLAGRNSRRAPATLAVLLDHLRRLPSCEFLPHAGANSRHSWELAWPPLAAMWVNDDYAQDGRRIIPRATGEGWGKEEAPLPGGSGA